MIPGEDGTGHDRHVIDGDLGALPQAANGGGPHHHNKRFRLRQRHPEPPVAEELNHAGTAKFVPVGNGLYKRVQLHDDGAGGPMPTFNPNPGVDDVHACCGAAGGPTPTAVEPHEDQSYDYENENERSGGEGNGYMGGAPGLPLMIAPMEFDGQPVPAQEEELLGELPSSLYFQASCILGDCQCGPSCTCEGCPVHDPARRSQLS
ncbi:hypothetical protein TRICI_003370 [Trichomonascus ciferrii]|uniref:Copper-fist domain-containing protein n=1 Tax=Trichomonascus ciferrii TaxID=44093 RepID=A0A642V421_9ASCO|nr:hypothetical protein TRICI_003370 [Trichomonascus ciferrii]